MEKQLQIQTAFSPNLLSLYDLSSSIVVVIDVLRATSTIPAALYNGALKIIPVDSVPRCKQIAESVKGISAGERNGTIAEGLEKGNSPLDFPPEVIKNRTLVLTTTNGTMVIQQAYTMNADTIITGGFVNLTAVCNFLQTQKKNIFLACSGWKGFVNIEDTLLAGAVIQNIKKSYPYNLCDSSKMADMVYEQAKYNVFDFIQKNEISHYLRLKNSCKDIELCFQQDAFPVLPIYEDGILKIH